MAVIPLLAKKWDEVRIGTNWAQVVPSSNVPGPANAAHSLMSSANPASIVADGASTSVVKVQARDINGVNLATGGATVTFTTTLGTVGSTTDNGDGTYQANLTSSASLGSAKVTAKLGGTTIATIGTATNSASSTVNFVLGSVSATASTAVANPTTAAADGNTASTITVTAMDDYNHPIAGQTVLLNVSGSGNAVSTPAVTDVNGHTTATLTSNGGGDKNHHGHHWLHADQCAADRHFYRRRRERFQFDCRGQPQHEPGRGWSRNFDHYRDRQGTEPGVRYPGRRWHWP
ncbi:MAG: invasin domain 3-containing protein [Limisphaerales bacterium]